MESLHEKVITELQARKGAWRLVAKGSQVSLRTIEKIARREIVDPGISKVQALLDFCRKNPLKS